MPNKTGGLGDLVYPYIQMAMALLKFVQGARLAPLRLHIIRACLRVTQHTNVYVPLAPPLLEMFRFPELAKSSNVRNIGGARTHHTCARAHTHAHIFASALLFSSHRHVTSPQVTGIAVNMECSIKISSTALRTRAACDSIVAAALAMLLKFCCLHAQSIAFPELVLPLHKVGLGLVVAPMIISTHKTKTTTTTAITPPTQELKEFINTTTSSQRRRQVKDLLERVTRNSEWVATQREGVVFDVHNLSQCSQLQGVAPLVKGGGRGEAWGGKGWGLQVMLDIY